ncbi:hypothetical protein VDG1235_3630 [Verrucomicrobiia bacterium DG1235]|nr:hypothetical protein VDG1235_3630 [Verrucomicrobiae bacterium DG1235]
MPSPSEIEEIIVSFIVETLAAAERNEIDREDNLIVDGILDSISIMRLIAHLETELDFKIPPRDLISSNFMTIKAMVTYLSSKAGTTP